MSEQPMNQLSRVRRVADPRQEIGSVAAHEETIQAISWTALAIICWMSLFVQHVLHLRHNATYRAIRGNQELNFL